MSTLTTVYKVTTKKRESAVITGKCAIKYGYRKWTTPKVKGSCILVFGSLYDARRFANNWFGRESYIIWEAEAEDVRAIKRLYYYGAVSDENNCQKFWNNESEGTAMAPAGTFGCNRIRLLKKSIDTKLKNS